MNQPMNLVKSALRQSKPFGRTGQLTGSSHSARVARLGELATVRFVTQMPHEPAVRAFATQAVVSLIKVLWRLSC